MKTLASAPGKALLFGEYAVTEGAPAVVAAVDRRVHASVEASPDPQWHLTRRMGDVSDAVSFSIDAAGHPTDEAGELVRAVLEGLLHRDPRRVAPLSLEVDSRELFLADGTKLGLGSSAAVTVALAGALRRVLRPAPVVRDPGPSFLEDLQLHRNLQHGLGSGVDIAASTHGGVLGYQKANEGGGPPMVETLSLPDGLGVLFVWTGRSASTGGLLRAVRTWGRAHPEGWGRRMGELTDLARAALEAFRSGRAEAVPALASAYHQAMGALGADAGADIVSAPHGELQRVAAPYGAQYKPSGAGGGDLGVVFHTDPDALERTGASIEAAGYKVLALGIDPRGITVREA